MNSIKPFLPYFKHLKPVKRQFILGILFGILYSLSSGLGLPLVAEIIFPVLFGNVEAAPEWLQRIVIDYFDGDTEGILVILSCLAIPIIMGTRALSSFGNGYYMTYTGLHVFQAMQRSMFTKIQLMPLDFFQKHKTGELVACVNDYPLQIKSFVVDMSNNLVKQPLTLLSACSFLIYKSIVSESFFVAAIGLATVPILVFPIRIFGKTVAKHSVKLVHLQESLNSSTIESIQSPLEIRSYNLEENQINRFKTFIQSIFSFSIRRARTSLFISPTIEFVSAAGISFSLYLGVRSGMGQGEFMALIIALYMAYSPAKQIGNIHNKLRTIEASLSRFTSVMDEQTSVPEPDLPVQMPIPFRGEIEFRSVSFDYSQEVKVLNNVSVLIQPGETVALVGHSGAGKSSFVNLIPRFYDISNGTIVIDGIDIRNFQLKDLREKIAYVPQSSMLFNASIMDNIRLGRENASDSEIIEAASQANALEFIETLPSGFSTILTERGASLSGGQRQRIAIARAFLKDAPILILDEATSSLDNKSDKLIQEALKLLAKGRTTLIIAHRLNSLKGIERRLCFDKGSIVGDGNHQQLMEKCPHYNQINMAAF